MLLPYSTWLYELLSNICIPCQEHLLVVVSIYRFFACSLRHGSMQAADRASLLREMIVGQEPPLRGLAVHRLRQDAAAAWPAPGVVLAPQMSRLL